MGISITETIKVDFLLSSPQLKEMSLLSRSLKDKSKSLYTTCKALSWSLLMRTFSFRLWNIHTTGQYEKRQITKGFIISPDDVSLGRALIFVTCFFAQRFKMIFKVQVIVYFDFYKFSAFTTGNCFIPDYDFTVVITR